MKDKITFSVIKADVGGWVGHSRVHPALEERAREQLAVAKEKGVLVDFCVTHCGDDLELIMTHRNGIGAEVVHKLAWDTFVAGTKVAKELKLYGAGQDLLSDAFSGNVKGMGPGVAEMEFVERKSEPVIATRQAALADGEHPATASMPMLAVGCAVCATALE